MRTSDPAVGAAGNRQSRVDKGGRWRRSAWALCSSEARVSLADQARDFLSFLTIFLTNDRAKNHRSKRQPSSSARLVLCSNRWSWANGLKACMSM